MSVFDDEHLYDTVLNHCIDTTLEYAGNVDGLPERDAISQLTDEIHTWGLPAAVLAMAFAALAVRMRRIRQTEAIVNSPEPGR